MFSTNPGIAQASLRLNIGVFHHYDLHNRDKIDPDQRKVQRLLSYLSFDIRMFLYCFLPTQVLLALSLPHRNGRLSGAATPSERCRALRIDPQFENQIWGLAPPDRRPGGGGG